MITLYFTLSLIDAVLNREREGYKIKIEKISRVYELNVYFLLRGPSWTNVELSTVGRCVHYRVCSLESIDLQ